MKIIITKKYASKGPEMETLKKNRRTLTDEERKEVMSRGAVWHHGPNGEETPGVWKTVVDGKTWYVCNTHRAYQCKPTLKGAIKAFDFIETTSNRKIKVIKISETKKEKKDFFKERTNKHIERVQNAAKKIVDKYSEYKELLEQVEDHDASKFEEPEMTPYIELTWLKKQNQDDDGGEDIEKATLHHIKNNKHHPEYHNKEKANIDSTNRDKSIECISAKNMDDISVAEMVADWQSMAEELGTNTSREWYNDVKDVRWRFSKKQEKLIDKLLKVFE